MSVVAAAVIGSAVVGGVTANKASKDAKKASQQGTQLAADTSIETTKLQLAEIQRQFDYQTRILAPQIQQQYNAQRAYSDLLGIGGPEIGEPLPPQPAAGAPIEGTYEAAGTFEPAPAPAPAPRPSGFRSGAGATGFFGGRERPAGFFTDNADRRDAYNRPGTGTTPNQNYLTSRASGTPAAAPAPGVRTEPTMGAPGSSGMGSHRDPETGAFVDPNLDPTRLADDPALMQAYRENKVAEGAAGTGVYGDVFNESPGYAFAREEMDRASDRLRSAGGNYGGRAMMEAQRRAEGLANQEYYNWAAGRTSDLERLGAAEATDISRGDIAASQTDALRASDQARQDQSYYNYLQQLAQQAGFGGGSAAQAVNASQAAGAAATGAIGAGGAQQSRLYADQGTSEANIAYSRGAAINNAIQGGMSNYVTAGYAGANIPGF